MPAVPAAAVAWAGLDFVVAGWPVIVNWLVPRGVHGLRGGHPPLFVFCFRFVLFLLLLLFCVSACLSFAFVSLVAALCETRFFLPCFLFCFA